MKKTTTRVPEILYYESNGEKTAKLVKFTQTETKEYKNGTSKIQEIQVFNLDGKKIADIKNMSVEIPGKDDMTDATVIACYDNFFVAKHVHSSMARNEVNRSYKVYTYSGLAVCCSSEEFTGDSKTVAKIARRAKEVEDMFGKSIFKDGGASI